MEASGVQQAQMLQVACGPPPIPLGKVERVTRDLLVAAIQVGQEVDMPAAPTHQSCLDKVMAQDLAAQGWDPR